MAGSSEKQEHIHWLEISESLGVDVSREIEYYFNGVADLGGNPPQADDVQTEVSPTARQLALTAKASAASQPETLKMEPVKTTSMSVESTRQSNSKNPQSAKAAQRTVSKDKNDDQQDKSRDDLANILGLDWSTPAPPSVETPATRDKSETEEPKREKKPELKRAAVERKPAPTRSDSQTPDVDLLGWGTGAVESVARETVEVKSIDEKPPVAEKKKEPRPERQAEKPVPKATNPKRESASAGRDVLLEGFGAGLIDPPVASQTTSQEKPPSAVFEVPNKPVREAKAEKAVNVDPLGFFDAEANTPKGSDSPEDESDFDSLDDDDQIEEVEEPLLESAWDEDFVEFEVEDLDPNAGRQPNRKREDRKSRPARDEKTTRREITLQDDDSADMEADSDGDSLVSKDTRSDKSDREGATRSGTRSSRRRKPRGRRRSGENQSAEKPHVSNPPETAPRSRKPTSTPKPRLVESLDDDFDDDDDIEMTSSSDETRSAKSRNLPTWNETVDVIVQSNIASRKKPPSRRRRGGGGHNRQR